MTASIDKTDKSLYKQDFYLWLETTINQLNSGDFSSVDWQNLIEELEDMGRSEKRRVESLLTRLFEHLLKLSYWDLEKGNNSNHWKAEIRNFRKQLKRELKNSPSLKVYLGEIFDECYNDARELVADLTTLPVDTFPTKTIATIEQILDENWFYS